MGIYCYGEGALRALEDAQIATEELRVLVGATRLALHAVSEDVAGAHTKQAVASGVHMVDVMLGVVEERRGALLLILERAARAAIEGADRQAWRSI